MKKPAISILVPVYKVEAYLQRCVDSVLTQNFQNWEMILVDDGSPDRCPQICDKAAEKDERISVVHKANGGLPSARLAGFERARGEYLVFLDSDDWLLPNALSLLLGEIEKGYEIVRARILREDENGNRWFEDYTQMKKEFSKDGEYTVALINELSPYLHSAIYRAELFNEEVFLPLIQNNISLGEDWITNFLISNKIRRISYIEEPVYVYFLNRKSLITSYIRAWSYNEKVEKSISDCIMTMPSFVKELMNKRSVLAKLQYFFFPEVPFNWVEYKKIRKEVSTAVSFFAKDIPIPTYYYKFINYTIIYYIYSRLCCVAKLILKQRFHYRKELK